MDRLISLSVGTEGDEAWASTFQDLSELARNLGDAHGYVSVSSSPLGEDSDDAPEEDLFYDEETLFKVMRVLRERGLSRVRVESVINDLQNAGILFRERR
jgi:hypothetical protein